MEGNITFLIIIFIIVSRLLGALFRRAAAGGGSAGREGRQPPAKPVFIPEAEPAPEPPPAKFIDPWGFDPGEDDSIPVKRGLAGTFVRSSGQGMDKQPLKLNGVDEEREWRPPEKTALPHKKRGSSLLKGIEDSLSSKDKFLSAFIVHEILEPPKALKKGRRL